MQPETFYHIYNRGNNKQRIFFYRDNYLFFIRKIRKHLLPHLHLIAYCLMPNHFHLLAYPKESIVPVKFSNDLRVMLRSYTRAINNQEKRTGSLFQQHTKIKPLEGSGATTTSHTMTSSHSMTSAEFYPFVCFHYIHQNPLKAGLVMNMKDWEMSSFCDYAGLRQGTLCAKKLAYELLDIPSNPTSFIHQSVKVV